MSTLVFNAEETERKTTQKGKNYVRVKIEGGPWASVWGVDDANLILNNEGQTFKGDLKEDGDWKNLENVSLAGDEKPSTSSSQPAGGKATLSKDEWALKDKKDWLRRLYISHLSNLIALSEPAIGTLTYDKYRTDARKLANQDLLWIESGGTEEPF